jgi:PAS domain S-box-containing protein
VRGIMLDVTEPRRTHEALLASEERFHSFFDNVPVGLYRTSPDGRVLMANRALLLLLGCESIEELTAFSLDRGPVGPSYSRPAFRESVASRGLIVGLECEWTRRDGSIVFVRESARAVRGTGGEVLYYDGILEDFTERRRIEEALRESEERYRTVSNTSPS